MRQATKGDTVRVHYTGRLKDGTVFDSSREREALNVTLGSGQLISGFEDALMGMSVGEKKKLKIVSNEAYGPRREDLVIHVEKEKFPPHIAPRKGLMLNLKGPREEEIQAVVPVISSPPVVIVC